MRISRKASELLSIICRYVRGRNTLICVIIVLLFKVKLDELHLVPMLYPALKLMFAEHYDEMENKAVKRQLRIQRQRESSSERSSNPKLQKV